MVGYSNDLGSIHYSEEVLAKIVGLSTMECYGVVGMYLRMLQKAYGS